MKGLTIGGKHTYDDFGLKMLSFSGFSSPEVYTKYQEIPGRDGKLDLTEALAGEPTYKERNFTAEFDMEESNPAVFNERFHEIRNYLHGRVLQIVDDDEPDWIYEARVEVDYTRKNHLFYEIVISSDNVEPYKYKKTQTVVSVSLSSAEQDIILVNERKSVLPEFYCTAETTVKFGDTTHTMNAGTHTYADIILTQGNNVIKASGSGTLTITYQEGAL